MEAPNLPEPWLQCIQNHYLCSVRALFELNFWVFVIFSCFLHGIQIWNLYKHCGWKRVFKVRLRPALFQRKKCNIIFFSDIIAASEFFVTLPFFLRDRVLPISPDFGRELSSADKVHETPLSCTYSEPDSVGEILGYGVFYKNKQNFFVPPVNTSPWIGPSRCARLVFVILCNTL